MSLTSLSPTITNLNRSILFSLLSSNGQEDTLSNYSSTKLTRNMTLSLLLSMITYSSLLPATSLEVPTTLTRLFINGMVPSLFFSSPFLLVEPSFGILSRSAVIPIWVWPITTTAARNTTLSQLCTRPLEQSSSSTKRFPPMELMIWHHLSTKVTLIWRWQATKIKQRFVQVGLEIGTKDEKCDDQES